MLTVDKDEASLAALDITNESHLFLWDGVQVHGSVVEVGEESEPVQLHVTYPSIPVGPGCYSSGRVRRRRVQEAEEEEGEGGGGQKEMVMGFSKNTTLREIRVMDNINSIAKYYPHYLEP